MDGNAFTHSCCFVAVEQMEERKRRDCCFLHCYSQTVSVREPLKTMSDSPNIYVTVVLESACGFFSLNSKSLFSALLLLRGAWGSGEHLDSSSPSVKPPQQGGKGYHMAPEWGVEVHSPV